MYQFIFFSSNSRHLLALEADLCFTLIVGMHSQNTLQIFKFSYESHLEGPEKQATPSSYTTMQPVLSFGPGLQHTFVIKIGSKQKTLKV